MYLLSYVKRVFASKADSDRVDWYTPVGRALLMAAALT